MAWKKLTFVLIPHSQSTVKQFSVRRPVLIGVLAFLVLSIAVMIFYIIGFQSKSFLLSDARELREQNAILESIASEMDSSLISLTGEIDSLEAIAERIRVDAGISDYDLRLSETMTPSLTTGDAEMSVQRFIAYVNQLEERSAVFAINSTLLFDRCERSENFLQRLPSIRPADGFIAKEFKFLDHDTYSLLEKSYPGVNITNVEGTPIVATADGVVQTVSFSNEFGRYIVIDHQNGYLTRYTHLLQQGITVEKGDPVTRGEVIGLMGRTGISIEAVAPHTIYSIEHNGTFVDPSEYFLVALAADSTFTGETLVSPAE